MLKQNFHGTILVLDLDETLVHIKRVLKNQPTSFGELPPDFSWQPLHDRTKMYIGWKRPGFEKFFERIFEEVDAGNIFLCIWTTAAKRYALQALKATLGDNFDKIGALWTRQEYQKCGNKKDLCQLAKFLGCRLSNMVMVDDNSLVFNSYLRAGGIVWLTPPFCDPANQQDDDQLARVIEALERRFVANKLDDSAEEEIPSLTKNVRRFRQVMVNWMTFLHLRFHLHDLSLHVATHVLDELFLNEPNLIDSDPIEVATTCLYIGCCYGEATAIQMPEWITVAGGHIEYENIVACLQRINKVLHYPLVEVGDVPVIILQDYLAQFRGLSKETRKRLAQRARYVLELCLLDFRYKKYNVKELVWTVLFFVTTHVDDSLWTGFALNSKYDTTESNLLNFVEESAVQGDRPMLGRNESNQRHQQKFVDHYGVFSEPHSEVQQMA